jgi:hypothetical protein
VYSVIERLDGARSWNLEGYYNKLHANALSRRKKLKFPPVEWDET